MPGDRSQGLCLGASPRAGQDLRSGCHQATARVKSSRGSTVGSRLASKPQPALPFATHQPLPPERWLKNDAQPRTGGLRKPLAGSAGRGAPQNLWKNRAGRASSLYRARKGWPIEQAEGGPEE
jgi:hypothetical protein